MIIKGSIINKTSPLAELIGTLNDFIANLVWTANSLTDYRRPLPHFLRNLINRLNIPTPAFAAVILAEVLLYSVISILKIAKTFFVAKEDRAETDLLTDLLEIGQALAYIVGLAAIAAFLLFNFPMLLNFSYVVLSAIDIMVNLIGISYCFYQLYSQSETLINEDEFKTLSQEEKNKVSKARGNGANEFTALNSATQLEIKKRRNAEIKQSIIWEYGLEMFKSISYLTLILLGIFIAPAAIPTQLIMFAISGHDMYKALKPTLGPPIVKFYKWIRGIEASSDNDDFTAGPDISAILNINGDPQPKDLFTAQSQSNNSWTRLLKYFSINNVPPTPRSNPHITQSATPTPETASDNDNSYSPFLFKKLSVTASTALMKNIEKYSSVIADCT